MKRKIFMLFAFVLVITTGTSFAESGNLIGNWVGSSTSILPDGTVITGITVEGSMTDMEGTLFAGTFTFTLPAPYSMTMQANATGVINRRMILGLLSYEISAGVYQGVGLFQARLNIWGNQMTGFVCDMSDGSSSAFDLFLQQ